MKTSRYLASLDSVRTAIPNENFHEWWFPTNQQRQIALELGRSELMVRLLMGDNIGLSINQAFDSQIWLEAAQYIHKLNNPSISLSLIGTNPNPKSFVEQVAIRFYNPSLRKQDFQLSTWPNLDENARIQVSKNLLSTYNFHNMFRNMGAIPDYMHKQSIGLQKYLDYLYRNQEKEILLPAGYAKGTLWRRTSDKTIKNHMGSQYFDQIPGTLKKLYMGENGKRNLLINKRSVLYECISDFEVEIREKLRIIIDYHYNGMLAQSVSQGRSSLSSLSLNKLVDLDEMKEQVEISDEQYDPSGLVNVFGLVKIDKTFSGLEPLSWEQVFSIIESTEFELSLAKLNSIPPGHPDKEAITEEHIDFLSKILGGHLIGGSQFLRNSDKAVSIVIAGLGVGFFLYTIYFGIGLSQVGIIQDRIIEKLVDIGVGMNIGLAGEAFAVSKPLLTAAENNLVGKLRKSLLRK